MPCHRILGTVICLKKKKNTQSGQLYIEQTSSQDLLFTSRQKVIHVDVLGVIVSLLELPVTAL